MLEFVFETKSNNYQASKFNSKKDKKLRLHKRHFISETIKTIFYIKIITEKLDMGGYIALKEFEKAFETIEWAFLLKCLKVFNFGE